MFFLTRRYVLLLSLIAVTISIAFTANSGGIVPGGPTPIVLTQSFTGELTLTVEPGTTEVTATWNEVVDATSYEVKWRPTRGGFVAHDSISVTDPAATFDVREQGVWVIRVVACNVDGCEHSGSNKVSVIINVPGRPAVRRWYDAGSIHLDWDSLPGYYVVKYRLSTDNTRWKTSEPLSEAGYVIDDLNSLSDRIYTAADLAEFKRTGKGLPYAIIRVYFNCDANGDRCTLLGRWPDHNAEQVNPRHVPMGYDPENTGFTENGLPLSIRYPSGGGTRSADETTGSANVLERDPRTNVLRPRSDFTITEEIHDGVTYRCVARPAENAWERAKSGNVVKSCEGDPIVETIDRFKLERSAAFPDDARCGERPSKSDEERDEFGAMVKVCNDHPDFYYDNNGNDASH